MSWHYRAARLKYGGFGVVEEYHFEDGEVAHTDPLLPYGENIGELIECLEMMVRDLKHDGRWIQLGEKSS